MWTDVRAGRMGKGSAKRASDAEGGLTA
jgi:hypothetical protein